MLPWQARAKVKMAEKMARERMEKAKTAKAKVARQEFILESPLGNAAALCSSLQPDHVAVLFFLRILAGKGGRGDGRHWQLSVANS